MMENKLFNPANQIDIKKVNLPHNFMSGRFRLSKHQYLLLLYTIYHVDPEKINNILTYIVSMPEFKEAIGNNTSSFYDDMEKEVKTLFNKAYYEKGPAKKRSPSGKRRDSWTKLRILSMTRYNREELKAFLVFAQPWEDQFKELQRKYVKVNFDSISGFTNFYEMRLFHFLQQISEMQSIWRINISNLLLKMGLISKEDFQDEEVDTSNWEETPEDEEKREKEEKYYMQYKKFKEDILVRAIKKINEIDLFNVSFREIKNGKRVEQLEFIFKKKTESGNTEKEHSEYIKKLLSDEYSFKGNFENTLTRLGMELKTARFYIKKYGEDFCQAQYDFIIQSKKQIKNPAGYFVDACKDNYAKFGK